MIFTDIYALFFDATLLYLTLILNQKHKAPEFYFL
jgi:hypothetical protein